jgi:hypothetical protein
MVAPTVDRVQEIPKKLTSALNKSSMTLFAVAEAYQMTLAELRRRCFVWSDMGQIWPAPSAELRWDPEGLRRKAQEAAELAATARDPVVAQELWNLATAYHQRAVEIECETVDTRR